MQPKQNKEKHIDEESSQMLSCFPDAAADGGPVLCDGFPRRDLQEAGGEGVPEICLPYAAVFGQNGLLYRQKC